MLSEIVRNKLIVATNSTNIRTGTVQISADSVTHEYMYGTEQILILRSTGHISNVHYRLFESLARGLINVLHAIL